MIASELFMLFGSLVEKACAIHLSRQSLKTSVYYDRDGELESKADRARSLKNDISEVAQNGMFNPSL